MAAPCVLRAESSDQVLYRSVATSRSRIDADRGVLYISLSEPADNVTCELDDEEIFVFRDAESNRVVAFTVPHFVKYWSSRRGELLAHLSKYVEGHSAYCLSSIYFNSRSVGSAFRVAGTIGLSSRHYKRGWSGAWVGGRIASRGPLVALAALEINAGEATIDASM